MSHGEELLTSPRGSVLPSVSNRTLHHPSFLPLFMTANFGHQRTDWSRLAAPAITPAEFYYTDPSMDPGRRIPNTVTDLRVLECFRLNTPPPVMTTGLAAPYRPDPFRSAPHPTRDLGSATCSVPALYGGAPPRHAIVQLTPEEDQAITNLLKLHHQGALPGAEACAAAKMDFPGSLGPAPDLNHIRTSGGKPLCRDMQRAGGWSDTELEAANMLSSAFIVLREDEIWDGRHRGSVETHPQHLPPPEAEAASAPTQRDAGFSRTRVCEEPSCRDVGSAGERLEPGGVPELSDPEGDAVHVLLTLGNMEPLDVV